MSRIIFKLTVARGGPGLFSNSLLHAGVQEYFQIKCRMQGLGKLKKQVAVGAEGVDTIEHCRTLLNTVEHC